VQATCGAGSQASCAATRVPREGHCALDANEKLLCELGDSPGGWAVRDMESMEACSAEDMNKR